jgi:hypothetical protein
MATAQTNNFNFDQYNTMMKGVGTGLKLHLAVQMIKDVVSSLEYFDNPLESEVRPIYNDLKAFHSMYKESSKKAQAAKEDKNNSSASIDNSTVPTIGVADMMKMFAEFTRMQAAAAQGNSLVEHSASESIKEIQNGALHTQGDAVQQAA